MDPHQRVHLRSLLVIGQDELCAPTPVRRMPPLEKPSVSAPIRRRVPLTHRSSSDTALRDARSRDPFQERAALRAPSSIRASDSSVRTAPARVVACENCRRRSRRTGPTVDHYRTTENRKVAFETEPVDQILSVDFNDSGPLRALFYGLQELQESTPALC